ncbi:MAG: flap structure-specific endonuclease [Candidatus Nanoarchaeia archaeon]
MGVAIKDILVYHEIFPNQLANKKIAIDSFNMIFSFLSSIRQADGQSLVDSKGRVTSHLKGLFSRCLYFKKHNITPIFIFDGEAPKLKEKEQQARRDKRALSKENYQRAKELGLLEDSRKYAQGTSELTSEIIEQSQNLIKLFGFSVMQAPSEAEAQGARLVREKKVYSLASQDFDSLLFNSPYLIRNFSITSKRKVAGTSTYKDTQIEFYSLQENLETLNISQDELIYIAILCGTDFNPGGIKGIGPKKALKLVKEYRNKPEDLFKVLKWHDYFSFTWIEVFNTIKKMQTAEMSEERGEFNQEEIIRYLKSFDFEEESLKKQISNSIPKQKGLESFF